MKESGTPMFTSADFKQAPDSSSPQKHEDRRSSTKNVALESQRSLTSGAMNLHISSQERWNSPSIPSQLSPSPPPLRQQENNNSSKQKQIESPRTMLKYELTNSDAKITKGGSVVE